jgi:hypothetical protein
MEDRDDEGEDNGEDKDEDEDENEYEDKDEDEDEEGKRKAREVDAGDKPGSLPAKTGSGRVGERKSTGTVSETEMDVGEGEDENAEDEKDKDREVVGAGGSGGAGGGARTTGGAVRRTGTTTDEGAGGETRNGSSPPETETGTSARSPQSGLGRGRGPTWSGPQAPLDPPSVERALSAPSGPESSVRRLYRSLWVRTHSSTHCANSLYPNRIVVETSTPAKRVSPGGRPSRITARFAALCLRNHMSMDSTPTVWNLSTCTSRVCPIRCARSMACSSCVGLKASSNMKTAVPR